MALSRESGSVMSFRSKKSIHRLNDWKVAPCDVSAFRIEQFVEELHSVVACQLYEEEGLMVVLLDRLDHHGRSDASHR
jgi:hypothetical protein